MDHQGLFVQRLGAGVQVGVGRTEHAPNSPDVPGIAVSAAGGGAVS